MANKGNKWTTGSRQYGAPTDPRRGPQNQVDGSIQYGQQGIDSREPKTKKEDPSPPGQVVAQFHKNSDVDARREAQHHTLGPTSSQASPGDHTHDGGTSRKLLDGYVLTGSKSTPATMWPSILACLVRLGAEDTTTA